MKTKFGSFVFVNFLINKNENEEEKEIPNNKVIGCLTCPVEEKFNPCGINKALKLNNFSQNDDTKDIQKHQRCPFFVSNYFISKYVHDKGEG